MAGDLTPTEALADLAYWNELAAATGWRVMGFTYKRTATFIDARENTVTLDGRQRDDILRAIQQAVEAADREAAERKVERGAQAPTANPSAAAEPLARRKPPDMSGVADDFDPDAYFRYSCPDAADLDVEALAAALKAADIPMADVAVLRDDGLYEHVPREKFVAAAYAAALRERGGA